MRMRASLALAGIAMAASSSCALISDCPATLAEAGAADFSAVGDDTFVGTGFVIRYVPSPEATASRGYDLNIIDVFQGERPPAGGFFLRVAEPIDAIEQGAAVLVVAEPTSNEVLFVPGPCTPMVEVQAGQIEP
jgi:hypothetical protein